MFTPVESMTLRQKISAVLNVPGNLTRRAPGTPSRKKEENTVLEIALVYDMSMEQEQLISISKGLAKSMKSHSEIFRNVRVNFVQWFDDNTIIQDCTALPIIQMGRITCAQKQSSNNKKIAKIFHYLRMFQARTKIVFLITNGQCIVENSDIEAQELQPFLGRKLIIVTASEEGYAKIQNCKWGKMIKKVQIKGAEHEV